MIKNYELYFLKDSPPGHHWNPDHEKLHLSELDKKQHWKAGEVYSSFTWDEVKDGKFKIPFDIFEIREVK